MSESQDIKNFHDLKRYAERLEYCMVTLVGWLVQSHVFGQHDFEVFVKLLGDEQSTQEGKGE